MRHPCDPTRRVAAALVLAAALAGCSRSDESREPRVRVTASRHPLTDRPDSLRAGDIRIVTPDHGIDLALIGDTISTGLSPQALEKVRTETDTAQVTGSGIGASFEKLVKRTVAGSIGTRVGVPLSSVRDVRYEGGAIRFDWVGAPPQLFVKTNINGKPLLESFAPADAQRFVDAVRARQGASATQQ